MRRHIVLALIALLLAFSSAVPSWGATTSTPLMRVWSPQWMTHTNSYTDADAAALAKSHDIVVAMKGTFKNQVAVMKSANSSLKLFAYQNATFGGNSFAETLYAHNANGQRITATDFPGTYMMDLNQSAWADQVANLCTSVRATSGYDGCFLDVLGSGPLMGDYMSSVPINTRTGKAWTQDEWLAAANTIVQRVAQVNPGVPLIGNGLGSGIRYFQSTAPSSKLIGSGLTGAMPELWLRTAGQGVSTYRRETDGKKEVDMLIDAQTKHTGVFTTTKLWVTATQAQKDAWHKYALASFLMATDGSSYFTFLPDHGTTSSTYTHPWDRVDVGSPSGSYAKVGSVYQRSFSNGISLVNPTTSTYTVSLGGTYRDLDGNARTSVTLGPNSGEVLTKS